MCGLYGFINRGKTSINANGLTKGLATSAMVRGKSATGISYNVDDHLCTIKAATPADKFVIDLPKSVKSVMGHTRQTTKGSETFNYNNHPFNGVTGGSTFALAHNGVLDNDYDLQLSEELPITKIMTDTYVAVQLLEKYSAKSSDLTFDAIQKMSEKVSGMFAFTILDNKDFFWIVRNDSPVYLVKFPKLNLFVYGSTKQIVEDGLKRGGITGKYEQIPVDEGEILCIDLEGTIHRFTFKVNERFYNYNNKWYSVANGGCSVKPNKSSGAVVSASYREDVLWHKLYDEGLYDDEIELLLANFSVTELDEAIVTGTIEDYLLEALRDFFIDAQKGGTRNVPYVSPLYKA